MAGKGTQEVVVLTPSYMYHGHTYLKKEVIDMDLHDIAPAVARGQIKIKTTAKKRKAAKKKPVAEKKEGPQ